MIEKGAVRILLTFDKAEFKAFKRYLLKNNRASKLLCRIFSYIQSKRTVFQTQPKYLKIDVAYKKICKEKIESKGKKVFLHALYDLHKELKRYLLLKAIEEDSFERDQLLIKIYQERQLDKEVDQTITKRRDKISKLEVKDHWQSLQLFHLDYQAYFEKKDRKLKDRSELLTDLMKNLDDFFCTFKLLLSTEMVNRENLLDETYEIKFQEEVIAYLKDQPIESNILSNFYFHCLTSMKSRTVQNVEKLAKFLENYGKNLSIENQNLALMVQLNCWIYLSKTHPKKAPPKILKIYKEGLKKEFFLINGKMSHITFNNIIIIGSQSKEFQWSHTFIQQYQSFLSKEHRAPSVNLCKASILFSEEKYDEMLHFLNNVEFKNIVYAIRTKSMILRAYYENQESKELILSFCKSFKSYLEDDQHFQANIMGDYLCLIKYIRIFCYKKIGMSKKALIEKIQMEEHVSFKPWLLKKAAAIKANTFKSSKFGN